MLSICTALVHLHKVEGLGWPREWAAMPLRKGSFLRTETRSPSRGVQPFGFSGPHWKKSCLGPHIKYTVTCNHKQKEISYFK